MVDPDGAICSQCGAPISPGAPAGLCPRCFLSDTQVGQSKGPKVSPSSAEKTLPKRMLSIDLAIGAVLMILLGILAFGARRGEQRAVAVASHKPGDTAKAQAERDQAIAELRAAIARKPPEEMAKYRANSFDNYGNDLYRQGKLEEAITEFRAAIWLNPYAVDAHGNLGLALADQGKLDEAVAEFRTAIRLSPDRAEPHYDLGLALRKQGKSAEAIAEFRKARANARPGSALTQLIDRELAATNR
jgi:tetratricopeptide (TPR) repeat protein